MKEFTQTTGLMDAEFVAKRSQPRITLLCIENYTLERNLMCVLFVEEDLYFLHPNVKKLYVFADVAFKSFVVHIHHTQI